MTMVFDGTAIKAEGNEVTVTEGSVTLTLVKHHRSDCFVTNARHHVEGMIRANSITRWDAERIVYCFGLAQRWIALTH